MLKAVTGFARKYWRELLLFAAAWVVMFQIQACDRRNDDAIADMIADKALHQVRARDEAIVARYAPQLAAKDAELAATRSAEAAAVAKVGERDRQLTVERAKVRTLPDCKALLEKQQAEYKKQAEDAAARFESLDKTWAGKFTLQVKQDTERLKAVTDRLGQVTLAYYKLQLRARAKLIIGPQVGYGPGGAYVGFGATYDVVRLRVP